MLKELLTLYPVAFGLDISDRSIKIARLRGRKHGYSLASYGNFPIPKGIIESGSIVQEIELAEAIRSAVKNVQGEKLNTHRAVVSLPEEKAFLQVMQIPMMKREEAVQAVRFEAENHIPLPLEAVYLDFDIIQPAKDHLDHLDILLASLPRTTVDSYVSVLEKAGLLPVALEIESQAITRSVIKDGIAAVPVLVVDIGATRTRMSVYSGYSLRFSTSVQNAGGIFSDGAKNKREFTGAIQELQDEIVKHIEYYESHSNHQYLEGSKAKVGKILLCGGGSTIKDVPDLIRRGLKIKVQLADPWVNIFSQPYEEIPPISLKDSLSYATALGLALRGASRYD